MWPAALHRLPRTNTRDRRPCVIPESRARPDPSVADFLPVFAVIFAAMVALVLFIACANVANLMLSRSLARQRDLVVRSALGASRPRLVRLQVVESVLLAFSPASSASCSRPLGPGPGGLRPPATSPSTPTTPGTGGSTPSPSSSAVAGVATGLWPALQASRFDLGETLKEGGSRPAALRHPFRNLLVVGQVTMSLVVLVSAALFLRSLDQMRGLPLGFRPDHLLVMSLDLGSSSTRTSGAGASSTTCASGPRRCRASRGRLLSTCPSTTASRSRRGHRGEIAGSKDGYVSTAFNVVGPGFFETAGPT